MIGHALPESLESVSEVVKSLRLAWVSFIKHYRIKAFPQIVAAPVFRQGAEALMLISGLGGLSCNTVCVPLMKLDIDGNPINAKSDRDQYYRQLMAFLEQHPTSADPKITEENFNNLPVKTAGEYCAMMFDTLRLELNLIVACNYTQGCHHTTSRSSVAIGHGSFFVGLTSPKIYTDIWLVGEITEPDHPNSLSSIWGYSASVHKAHTADSFSLSPVIDGGRDENDIPLNGLYGLVALIIQLGSIANGSRLSADNGVKATKLGKLRILHVPSLSKISNDWISERESYTATLFSLCERARIDIAKEDIKIIFPPDVSFDRFIQIFFCADCSFLRLLLHIIKYIKVPRIYICCQ